MELIELIKASKNIVAFAGAGLSTESGIPDFRSSSGLYLSGKFEGYTPEQILSSKFFRTNKPIFFDFYKQRIMSMADKQPNRAHHALKKLEDLGKLTCVINQNIDNLLQKAGVKCAVDLHGNISQFRCISACGATPTQEEFMKKLETSDVPRCECGGVIRPNTVLFDEWLNDDAYDSAYYAIKKCDLLLVIGSSCIVRPAATLIGEISDICKLVIINNSSTPYDKRADLIINKSCGEVLEEITNSL
jgi:NAD-dependent deacetylase